MKKTKQEWMNAHGGENEWMTAQELAKMYGIGVSTLYRLLKGPPKGYGKTSIDLRRITEQRVGGRRRWSRSAAERLLQGAE